MLATTAGYAARPGSSPAPGGSRPIDLAGLVHTASASPADPIFMSYPNVPGESTDALHPNWIALNSWSFGVTKATTSAPTFTALTVTMPTSRATPPLFAAVTKGTVAATATLQAAKPIGTSDKNYLTVTLTNVRIGHWDDSQPPASTVSRCRSPASRSLTFCTRAAAWPWRATRPAGICRFTRPADDQLCQGVSAAMSLVDLERHSER